MNKFSFVYLFFDALVHHLFRYNLLKFRRGTIGRHRESRGWNIGNPGRRVDSDCWIRVRGRYGTVGFDRDFRGRNIRNRGYHNEGDGWIGIGGRYWLKRLDWRGVIITCSVLGVRR